MTCLTMDDLRTVCRFAIVRPTLICAGMVVCLLMIEGHGDPFEGLVRSEMEVATAFRPGSTTDVFLMTACLDAPQPVLLDAPPSALPDTPPKFICEHLGEKQVTVSSVTSEVREQLLVVYLVCVGLSLGAAALSDGLNLVAVFTRFIVHRENRMQLAAHIRRLVRKERDHG